MRHPRLNTLVAVAHGSKDPRAAATIYELAGRVRSQAAARGLADLDVKVAFLDHCAPSVRQALSAVADQADGACVVVPLLLTPAYHSKTDIPAHIASAQAALSRGDAPPRPPRQEQGARGGVLPGLDVRYADTLGPHPLLLAALERRLAQAGGPAVPRSATSIVLAAAGSSDPAANATIAAVAARWQRDGGWRAVVPAYASAASPAPAEVIGELIASGDRPLVATYLLAPGYFADKIRGEALGAGAVVVSSALGAAPEVAGVILDRYAAAAARADAGVVAKAQLS